MTATVTQLHVLSMQICIPKDWTDEQAKQFADTQNPCGTRNGWFVCKDGDDILQGDSERVDCLKEPDHVHLVLVA